MNDWTLKMPTHLRPAVDELAREAFLPTPEYVRQLVQRAVFERQLERGKAKREQSKTV